MRTVPPLYVDAVLAERPPRASGLSDPDALRRYHRDRFRTRGHEALTPGADLDLSILPIVRHRDGRWELSPGAFATTSAEILYSPSFSLLEKHVWTYLFNHRCLDRFRRTGESVVESVRLADLAATAGVSISSVSRAVAKLDAKRRLTRQRRGLGRPNRYTLNPYESGASAYPIGHARSARKRLEALVRRALDDLRSHEALALTRALGFALHGHTAHSLTQLLWRRLDRAVHESFGPPPERCPHDVENAAPVSPPAQNRSLAPAGSLLPPGGFNS